MTGLRAFRAPGPIESPARHGAEREADTGLPGERQSAARALQLLIGRDGTARDFSPAARTPHLGDSEGARGGGRRCGSYRGPHAATPAPGQIIAARETDPH